MICRVPDSPLATEEHGREPASAAACERELKLKSAMVTGGVRRERVMAWLAGCRPALALVAVAVGQPMNDMGARLHVHASSFSLFSVSLYLPCTHTLRAGKKKIFATLRALRRGRTAQAGRVAVKMKRWFVRCCCRSRKNQNQSN